MSRRLSKFERKTFQNILCNAERTMDYLRRDEITIYENGTRVDPETLNGLRSAIGELGHYLATH